MHKRKLDVDKMAKKFLKKCQQLPKVSLAAVHPCSQDSLNGAVEAAQLGLVEPKLIGPEKKIRELAEQHEINIEPYELINVSHSHAAAEKAIALVHEGVCDSLMKGSIPTDELMRAVIKKDTGLRTGRRISHVFVMAMEKFHKPFIVTDAAININPDFMTKKDILQNAIDLAHVLDMSLVPKVAILSAIETINPEIQSTIDAACLCKMADRGQILGAIVDGPFAYDNVISLHAAKTKNITSPVIGDVDIFLVPNLEAGNMLSKQMVLLMGALSAGMILGATVPIILTSRADGVRSRIGSCAIAVMMANAKRLRQADAGV